MVFTQKKVSRGGGGGDTVSVHVISTDLLIRTENNRSASPYCAMKRARS